MTNIDTLRHRGAVEYRDGHLTVSGPALDRTVSAAAIGEIYRCTMADEIHHGDEGFHILILADTVPDGIAPNDAFPDNAFLLIGPFVAGGLGALKALTAAHPEIPVTPVRVRTVPYGFREPGFMGLRLFPVPGLRVGSRAVLKRFRLRTVSPERGDVVIPPKLDQD